MSQLIITPKSSCLLLTISLILLSFIYHNSVYGQSEGFSNYENAKFGYNIQYPRSWYVTELPSRTYTFFNSSDNSAIVIVDVYPTNRTFEQFSSGMIHNFTSSIKSLNELSRDIGLPGLASTIKTDKATLSGIDAWKVSRAGSDYTAYHIWTVKNNYVYLINFHSDHINGIIYEPVFQKMVNSFQIIK